MQRLLNRPEQLNGRTYITFINFNKCSYFFTIDLNSAYVQIEVHEYTYELLVINTHRGLLKE